MNVTCSTCQQPTDTAYAGEWVRGIEVPRKKGLNHLVGKERTYEYVCPSCIERIRRHQPVGQQELIA